MKYLILIMTLVGCGQFKPKDGKDGKGCETYQTSSGTSIKCGDTETAVSNGTAGQDGDSCEVEKTAQGTMIICSSSTSFIADGQDGTDGQDATLPDMTFVEAINPCGMERNDGLDEIIFRTYGGELVAYAAMNNGYLTFLEPGNYVTTDGTNCSFKVTVELEVTWNE